VTKSTCRKNEYIGSKLRGCKTISKKIINKKSQAGAIKSKALTGAKGPIKNEIDPLDINAPDLLHISSNSKKKVNDQKVNTKKSVRKVITSKNRNKIFESKEKCLLYNDNKSNDSTCLIDVNDSKYSSNVCLKCNKSFANKYYLVNHERLVHSTTTVTCSKCNKTFAHMYYLKIHERVEHSSRSRLPCKICKRTPQNLNRHFRDCIMPKVRCQICTKVVKQIEKHIKKRHGNAIDVEKNENTVRNVKKSNHSLNNNLRNLSFPYIPNLCPFIDCKEKFPSLHTMYYHVRVKHNCKIKEIQNQWNVEAFEQMETHIEKRKGKATDVEENKNTVMNLKKSDHGLNVNLRCKAAAKPKLPESCPFFDCKEKFSSLRKMYCHVEVKHNCTIKEIQNK